MKIVSEFMLTQMAKTKSQSDKQFDTNRVIELVVQRLN